MDKQRLIWVQLKRMLGISPSTPIQSQEGQLRYARDGSVDGKLYLARRVAAGTYEWKDLTAAPGAASIAVERNDVSVDSAVTTLDFSTQFTVTSSPSGEANISLASTGATVEIDEGGSKVNDATIVNFDATDFNVSNSPAGTANVSLAYGTTANVPAEGNHTHTMLTVSEGGVGVDSAVLTINYDSTDFNVSSSPSGTANISLAYGTTANVPAEGNHTHAAALIVSEGGTPTDSAVTTVNFDATDFNVSSSPAGTANISLAYGTTANVPAEGNHAHSGTYQPLDTDLTTIAGLVDPNADRILFWDDSAGAYAYLAPSTGLTITTTNMVASVVVAEGGTPTDSAVTTLNFDATDFNTSSSPAGTANISLAYGTTANTPAEGNHTHSSFAGAVSFDGDVTVGNSQADNLTIASHVFVTGTDPTLTATPVGTYPAAGTTPTSVAISWGNDTAGQVAITTGSGPVAGRLINIAFASARASTDYAAFIQPRTSGGASLDWTVRSRTTAGFDIHVATAPGASTDIGFFYWVIEG